MNNGRGQRTPREVGSAAMRIQYHNSMVLSAKIPLNLYSSSTMQEDKNAMRYNMVLARDNATYRTSNTSGVICFTVLYVILLGIG